VLDEISSGKTLYLEVKDWAEVPENRFRLERRRLMR